MQRLLATMFTTTTYGTWLPGDVRGYVDEGRVLPGDAVVLRKARRAMAMRPVLLTVAEQDAAFESLVRACEEFSIDLLAASVESWHLHCLVNHRAESAAKTIARLKNRVRQRLDRGRIWTAGYDKRFCFDEDTVRNRRAYIARHAGCRPVPMRTR